MAAQKESNLDKLLKRGALDTAQGVIGWRLYRKEGDSSLTGGVIVETEAYSEEDAASHSYRGKTPRTEVMFGPAGRMYVYFTYGMHWCMNIVTGEDGHGEAVLIRAIEPDKGTELMRKRRDNRPDKELANGPAKVCQALAIDGSDNGKQLNNNGILLLEPEEQEKHKVKATERIGIRHDTHRLWRFVADY